MNKYKQNFFSTASQLLNHRLSVSQKQLTEYWYSLTLKQIQKVLSIHDQYLIYQIIVQHYLQYYLRNKKVSAGEYFYVMYQDKILMWVYDCKIFRVQIQQQGQGYVNHKDAINYTHKPSHVSEPSKQNNDLMSAFLIGYREQRNNQKPENQSEEIFEFLNFDDIVKEGEWVLKIKQSALMRIFPYLIQKLTGGSGQSSSSGQEHKHSSGYMENGSPWAEDRGGNSNNRYSSRNNINQQQNVRSSYSTSSTQSNNNTFYQSQPERNPIGLPYLTTNPNQRHQVVMLQPTSYYAFIYNLLIANATNSMSELSSNSHNTNSALLSMLSPQSTINSLFNYLTELMLNNLLLSWYQNTFTTSLQKHYRHFSLYFRLIEKPKIKEQFTSIETYFTQIKWQSFALPLYALKYNIIERDMVYECYQKQLKQEDLLIKQPYSCDGYLQNQDQDHQQFNQEELANVDSEVLSLQQWLSFTEPIQYLMENISILKAFAKRHKQYNYENDYHYRQRHYDPSLAITVTYNNGNNQTNMENMTNNSVIEGDNQTNNKSEIRLQQYQQQQQNCGQQQSSSNNQMQIESGSDFRYRNNSTTNYNENNKIGRANKSSYMKNNNSNNSSSIVNPLQSNDNPSVFYEQIIREYNNKIRSFHKEHNKYIQFRNYLNINEESQNQQKAQQEEQQATYSYNSNSQQQQQKQKLQQRKQLQFKQRATLKEYNQQQQEQVLFGLSAKWFMSNYDQFYLHFYNQYESLSSSSNHSFKYEYQQLYHQFQDQQFMYNFEIVLLNLEFQVMKALVVGQQDTSKRQNSIFSKLQHSIKTIRKVNRNLIKQIQYNQKEKQKQIQSNNSQKWKENAEQTIQ